METEKKLKEEIEKWSSRMEKEMQNMEPYGTKGEDFLKNIKAYFKDTGYFLKKEDLIRSFEAIVWAWAWLEIGKEMGFLRKEYVSIK